MPEHEHNNGAMEAGAGDAMGDASGGMALILMVLFLAVTVLLTVVLIIMKAEQPPMEEPEKPKPEQQSVEALAKQVGDLEKQKATLEEKNKKLEAEVTQLKKTVAASKPKAEKRTPFFDAGMIMWEMSSDHVIITDAKPKGRYENIWTQRWSCRRDVRDIQGGGGTPAPSHKLGTK